MSIEVIASHDDSMSHPEPGLRRQVMSSSPSMMLVRHRMKKGWVGTRHSHPQEQMVYIQRPSFVSASGRSCRSKNGRQFPGTRQCGTSGLCARRLRSFGHLHSLARRLRDILTCAFSELDQRFSSQNNVRLVFARWGKWASNCRRWFAPAQDGWSLLWSAQCLR